MKKLLIIFTLLLVLTAGCVALYFLFFTPDASAQRVADRVMRAANVQQHDDFAAYGTPDGSEAFYRAAAQRNYRHVSTASTDTTYYVRYKFTDSNTPNYARIAVRDGRVTALATGDNLGALPTNDKTDVADNTRSDDFCLAADDLSYLDSKSLYARQFRGATMFFAGGDSLVYAEVEGSESLLGRMADFYKQSSDKDYTFVISGYLAEDPNTHDERIQIVQNRVTKIQQDLMNRGIPDDRIVIGEPQAYPADRPTANENERYVDIDIRNNCID